MRRWDIERGGGGVILRPGRLQRQPLEVSENHTIDIVCVYSES